MTNQFFPFTTFQQTSFMDRDGEEIRFTAPQRTAAWWRKYVRCPCRIETEKDSCKCRHLCLSGLLSCCKSGRLTFRAAASLSECFTIGCIQKGIELLEFMMKIMLYIRPNKLGKVGYLLGQINLKKMVQRNQPTRCNSFTSLLLDVYVWLNMFRTTHRPSLGA